MLRKIKKISKDFNLDYSKGEFKFILLTKKQIVLTNFLGGCPFKPYNQFDTLEKFIKSKEFKGEIKNSQGRKISREELEKELELIKKITNKKLKTELSKIYAKLKSNMVGNNLSLSSEKDKEIIVHELLHELIDTNNIRPISTNVNEGLVYYLTEYVLYPKNYHKKIKENAAKISKNEEWNQTRSSALEWAKLLKDCKTPSERKEEIIKYQNKLK
jgi:hypothetical protein